MDTENADGMGTDENWTDEIGMESMGNEKDDDSLEEETEKEEDSDNDWARLNDEERISTALLSFFSILCCHSMFRKRSFL